MSTRENQTTTRMNNATILIASATDAVTVAALGESCVDELRTILEALVELSSAGGGLIHDLAKVGLDLAKERHNVLDCEREIMEQKLASLKGPRHV